MQPCLRDSKLAKSSDFAACRATLRVGSRTFYAASYCLPPTMAEPAAALYAFCRLADDEVDVGGGHLESLDSLRDRLTRIYAGRPLSIPEDRALAEVVARFAIPQTLLEALLEGMEWDARGRRYEDLSGLYAYSARVAGTVGAMMSVLMGARTPELLARACDLGVAMQLTNIARDVGEDARIGRLYLPLQWLREAGIDPETWLAAPVFNGAIAGVVQRLLRTADELYARAGQGIAQLPPGCRWGIYAAGYLYAEIGRQVERQGCDSISRRAIVPPSRKAWLLMRALTALASSGRGEALPPLEETRFLVDAVVAATPPTPMPERIPTSVGERLVWVMELFERLDRLDRLNQERQPGGYSMGGGAGGRALPAARAENW